MDKKFYYKTPALVAMTLAGTTLISHQANAEETVNNDNKNIIDQHDNAKQIQNEKKELQNQSLNITGSKEYKDPSIVDVQQPASDEIADNVDNTTNTTDNKDIAVNDNQDVQQPTSDVNVDNVDNTTKTEDNKDVVSQDSQDVQQPTSDVIADNVDNTTKTEDNKDVVSQDSQDVQQPTSDVDADNTVKNDDNNDVPVNDDQDVKQPASDVDADNTVKNDDNNDDQDVKQPASDVNVDNVDNATNADDNKDVANQDNQDVKQPTSDVNADDNVVSSESTTTARRLVSTPKRKMISAAPRAYKAAVSSTINNQIRNNNYTVPKYVEDFSSHIPKIPYRNGVGKPEGIIAHETANPNSTIQGEIAYMKNNYESAFVHAFVDDKNIIEVAPTDYLAWGAGAQANPRFIHVELVRVYGGDRFARSINNYADYLATNLVYYGLPLDSAEYDGKGTLWSHDAISKFLGGTNHSDPYGWFAENNYTFDELVELVGEKYYSKTNKVTTPTKPVVTKPKPVVTKPKPVVTKPSPTTKPVTSPITTKVVNYVGTVNVNTNGVYSTVTDKVAKSAASKAGKTFNIGKQATFNNQIFYLLQDNKGTPLGWVKSNDVKLQSNAKPTTKPVVKPAPKPVAKPKPAVKPAPKPVAKPKPAAKPATSPITTQAVKYVGTVNKNTQGIYSTVTDKTAKSAATKAGKTFNIGKQATYNKQVFYLLQDNKGTPLGWVKSNDVKLQTPAQPKTVKNSVPKTTNVNYVGTVNKNISGVYTSVYNNKSVPALDKAGKSYKIGKQSTYNNQVFYLLQDNRQVPLGWVKAQDVQLQTASKPKSISKPTTTKPKQTTSVKANTVNSKPVAMTEAYQNYVIFDINGYFYSNPSVSKNNLLGSLKNYQNAYFKVTSSQKVGNELWYKGILNGKTVWINAKHLQVVNESTKVTKSPYTLDQALAKQMALKNGAEPKKVLTSGVRKATKAEVRDAMDTTKYVNDPVQKYQFLDLNKSQNISVDKLNQLLRGKGILENQGSAFSQAAKAVGINEIYLISHALLESGNGTSKLANGGAIDSKGKVDLKAKTKYYNMFGIGAVDNNALYGGIKYAQQAGWNSPAKAILGGAQFISKNYIKAGQNTLYKMRFNPQNPGVHQYATGVDFAKSNAIRISDFYTQIQSDGQYYDIDQYKS
ncbi:N-acetylmuramoyl-L-alanine amidase [Mammaliicoccus stepanovicii]|uniref:N-acetylmuramoyl-L-alanine amidase n=1 Tax=Mammaliicoccus stepanovicii TaxID=643214 RepID=UPI000CD140B9|nr:GW dipeptide domain-containing protein [Mammaliicoccus stepanovicii]PNZ73687.1 hypothetical protein CD111_09610 [Mammaliicoccus stepanovicii]